MQTEIQVRVANEYKFPPEIKTVIIIEFDAIYPAIMDWIETNSNGYVLIKYDPHNNVMHIGFENTDDALFFKIKFTV